MGKVICGACSLEFENDKKYFKHKCLKTGYTPNTIEHLDILSGGRFSIQSKAALARGAAQKNKIN